MQVLRLLDNKPMYEDQHDYFPLSLGYFKIKWFEDYLPDPFFNKFSSIYVKQKTICTNDF